jgi:septal ring factor EnvC (AmiA/AmiB activator)
MSSPSIVGLLTAFKSEIRAAAEAAQQQRHESGASVQALKHSLRTYQRQLDDCETDASKAAARIRALEAQVEQLSQQREFLWGRPSGWQLGLLVAVHVMLTLACTLVC